MRIAIYLSPNRELVPYNYQAALVGAFHRWLGSNALHDDISLYSLSWLQGGKQVAGGFTFPKGGLFQISAPNAELFQQLIPNMVQGTHIRWGMEVQQANLLVTPNFGARHRFWANSPILIKRQLPEEKYQKYFFPSDPEANGYLTATLRHKLRKMGMKEEVEVAFDPTFEHPKIKKIRYKHIDIKATFCPVIVSGAPEAVAFAWEVGVGNSTGLGFGALR